MLKEILKSGIAFHEALKPRFCGKYYSGFATDKQERVNFDNCKMLGTVVLRN